MTKGEVMKLAEAIKIVSKYMPCPHDNYDARLGDGTTWAECEDCGETFRMENLQIRRKAAEDFENAIDCLIAISKLTV